MPGVKVINWDNCQESKFVSGVHFIICETQDQAKDSPGSQNYRHNIAVSDKSELNTGLMQLSKLATLSRSQATGGLMFKS